MAGIEALAGLALLTQDWAPAQHTDWEAVFTKGDHAQAYRQHPIRESHKPYVVTVLQDPSGPPGSALAFGHRALPFGASAAVWAYTRVAQAVCGICQRSLCLPQMAYVDDFLRCMPRCWGPVSSWAFNKLHALLGIPITKQTAPAVPCPPSESLCGPTKKAV